MDQSEQLTEEALSLAPLLILYSLHHSLTKRGLITIDETERTLKESINMILNPAKKSTPWQDETNRGICPIPGLFMNILRAGGLAALPLITNFITNRQILSTLRKITVEGVTTSVDSTLRKAGDLVEITSSRFVSTGNFDTLSIERDPPRYFKLSMDHSFVFGDDLKVYCR